MRTNLVNANTKIKAYLGPWGCQTRMLDFEELLDVAKMTFDVPGFTLTEVATNIEKLSPLQRSVRAREAIRNHWPDPTVLWPAESPVRKLLKRTS